MRRLFILFFIFFLNALSLFGQENQAYYRWNSQTNGYDFDFYGKEPNLVFDSLIQAGYYTLQVDSIINQKIYINKGKNYKTIWVKNQELFKSDAYFPTNNLDSIIDNYISTNNTKGYTFSNVKILPRGYQNNEQRIELILNLGEQRKIDDVKTVGYTNLSKGYIKHSLGLKKKKIYNDESLIYASNVLRNTNYISEIQAPQTLFRPDSTIVYLYPQKLKSNIFDGIIGFGNDETGKFRLNGNVLLELNNAFNGLEQIRLNWIATANKNMTLDFRVRLPYLFKSPIGSETQLKIFKQDSIFVNMDLNQRLFYQINPHSSLGGNITYTSSNFLLDNQSFAANYDDYTKIGLGISYDFFQNHPFILMEGKSSLKVFASTITRQEKNYSLTQDFTNEKSNQYEIGLSTYRIFNLYKKHYIKTSANFRGLFDKNESYSENELYRIGGFESIRGFNEESILANLYGIGSLEYRFLPNEGFYISLFGDYAFIDNKRINLNTHFISFGTGLSFLTKLGIFNLSYAVGKTENSPFDFKDSKVHFGILSQF